MTLEQMTKDLDQRLTLEWQSYVDYHNELDAFRGKKLEDLDKDEVNGLLEKIQKKFAELHFTFTFIAQRHQFVTNAVSGYNDFIDQIKKAGAVANEPDTEN